MNTVTWGTGGDYATLAAALAAYDFSTGSVIMLQVGASSETGDVITQALDFQGYTCWIKGNKDYTTSIDSRFLYINAGKLNGVLYVEGMKIDSSSVSTAFIETNNTTGVASESIAFYNNLIDTTVAEIIKTNSTTAETIYFYNNECSCFKVINKSTDTENIYIEDCFFFATATTGDLMTVTGTTSASKLYVRRVYITALTTLFSADIETSSPSISSEVYTDSSTTEVDAVNRSIAFTDANFNSVSPNNIEYGVPKTTSVLTITATQGTNIPDHNVGANAVTITTWAVGPYKPRVYLSLPTDISVDNLQSGVRVSWVNNADPGYEKTYLYWETVSVDEAFQVPKATVAAGLTEYEIPYSQLTESNIWYLRVTHGA